MSWRPWRIARSSKQPNPKSGITWSWLPITRKDLQLNKALLNHISETSISRKSINKRVDHINSNIDNNQLMVNCWLGLVVWIPGIPLWKGLLLGCTPRIANLNISLLSQKKTYPNQGGSRHIFFAAGRCDHNRQDRLCPEEKCLERVAEVFFPVFSQYSIGGSTGLVSYLHGWLMFIW